jgi:hypothetical protein
MKAGTAHEIVLNSITVMVRLIHDALRDWTCCREIGRNPRARGKIASRKISLPVLNDVHSGGISRERCSCL